MEKRKVILLGVAGVCLLAAVVALYFQMSGATEPKPKPPEPIADAAKGDKAVMDGAMKDLEIRQKEPVKGTSKSGG